MEVNICRNWNNTQHYFCPNKQTMALTPSKASAEAINLHTHLFGSCPEFVSVAPGRVNLIGEHVDHQGYSVLPAALNHSIQVAVSTGTKPEEAGKIIFEHKLSSRFPRFAFNSLEDVKVSKTPVWVNYAVAALFGVFEYATFNDFNEVGKHVKPNCSVEGQVAETAQKLVPAGGIRVSVDGCVPEAAGVSSSSALVVAMTVAFMNLLGVAMSREVTAVTTAKSERHTGVASGGMDQAAICLCKKGEARLIHFDPLVTEEIPLPSDGVLVVCNCGMESPKAVSAATCYNKRVFELKLACFIILKAEFPNEEITKEELPNLTLRYVQEKLKVDRPCAAEIAKKHLKTTPTSKDEAERILGSERLEHLLTSRVGPAVWERNVFFEPLRRVLHVYQETDRVFKFADVCRNENIQDDKKLIVS